LAKPAFELATIIKDYHNTFTQIHQPLAHHKRTLGAIENCRTAYLGGHLDKCDNKSCDYLRISYNSCRNRHCPKCQSTNKERWIEARQQDLMPTTYFHVVFTLPQELNTYCLNYPKELYNILFTASKETLITLGNDPKHLGAQMGMVSVLHTWGQNLSLHPHVHMIVPGCGMTPAGYWKQSKSKGKYLFPGEVIRPIYKGKFMEKFKVFLKENDLKMEGVLRQKLYSLDWVVYAKQPFGGPKDVIEYLGRYSHKIAISNHRIKDVSDGKVTFSYKDYASGGHQKQMTLTAEEFLRRFCLHILPPGFMKIRHYGFLASRVKKKLRMEQMMLGVLPPHKEKSDWKTITKIKLGFDVDVCPCCNKGRMIRILSFDANAPPLHYLGQLKTKTVIIKP
jgi:hypothetical protein